MLPTRLQNVILTGRIIEQTYDKTKDRRTRDGKRQREGHREEGKVNFIFLYSLHKMSNFFYAYITYTPYLQAINFPTEEMKTLGERALNST